MGQSPDIPEIPENRPPEAGRGKGTTGRTSARELAAMLVASGAKIKDAAGQAGIGERTLRRWLDEDAAFSARVQQMRAEMLDATLGRLSDSMTEASDVLRELLANEDPDIRYKASVKVVELGLKVRDQASLEDRVRKLEVQLGGGSADGHQGEGGKARSLGEAAGAGEAPGPVG